MNPRKGYTAGMAVVLRVVVTVEVTDRARRTPAAHLARALGISVPTLRSLMVRAGVDGDRLLRLEPEALSRLLSYWSRSHSGAKRLALLVGDALAGGNRGVPGQADSTSDIVAGRARTYAEMRAALHQHIRADQRDAKPDTMPQSDELTE